MVLDEFADIKKEAWTEVLRPTLSDTGGHALFCATPKGFSNWAYDFYQYGLSSGDTNWKSWQFTTLDGGNVPESEIEEAKRDLDPRTFRQEYLATFETYQGIVYGDYSNDNLTVKEFDAGLGHIIWTHDFNFTPLSSAILQVDENKNIYAVDEIVLTSAVARQTAIEFVERYKDHKSCIVKIYGDASGRIGEKHGHISDYLEIEKVLKQNGFRVLVKTPRSNPAIKDGQNSLRAKILNASGNRSFFVNPKKCKYVDKGLRTVQLKEGSTFQEEDSEYQHITTALRYFTSIDFPLKKTVGRAQPV